VWTLRKKYLLDEGKVSNLQNQTGAVVHHRRSTFRSRLLRQLCSSWRSSVSSLKATGAARWAGSKS